jgi:uroporphyrinogen III methyltransferase/synthase
MNGKVYLVGAGPGDEELITVKGQRLLQEADVVLYDRLSNSDLLDHCSQATETFYAGKKANNHYKTQTEINELLTTKAKAGNTVVRLKGGDPFIFGRGGEEAEFLNANNIACEVVPGITSPIAVPAYAGIPLTHRDINSSVAFVTGHEDPSKEETSINWEQLAQGVETIVTLMGVGNLTKIVEKLLAAGKSGETPIALISWGTTPQQKTVVGRLDNIVAKVEEAELKPPAITVIGENVNLHQELNYFENKDLFAENIVVTRPEKQAKSFCQLLAQEGANPIKAPAIEIVPPDSYQPLDDKLNNLDAYDWIVFTSVNGVKYVMERLFELGQDVRALAGSKLCSIGPKTAQALSDYGLRVDYVPDEYVSEAILKGFSNTQLEEQKFLLPRADIARPTLATGLRELGAEVDNVTAYRTVTGRGNEELVTKLKAGQIDMITFTSSSTVKNFLIQLGEKYQELLGEVKLACIGPITAQTAQDEGLEVDIIAEDYTIEGLLRAIIENVELRM